MATSSRHTKSFLVVDDLSPIAFQSITLEESQKHLEGLKLRLKQYALEHPLPKDGKSFKIFGKDAFVFSVTSESLPKVSPSTK